MAIDLKLGDFEAADKGQMELYLNWLKKHEQGHGRSAAAGHHPVRGSKRQEHVELLQMERDGIHVASYLTRRRSRKNNWSKSFTGSRPAGAGAPGQ